jgi:hypothetical protein
MLIPALKCKLHTIEEIVQDVHNGAVGLEQNAYLEVGMG